MRRSFLAVLICCLVAAPAAAQGDLSHVFPNGARQGSTITLTFAGKDLPDPAQLLVEGEGIRPLGAFVKGVGKIEVAADAAPGVRMLRLAGPRAGTSPRPFAVGALPELAETEPNSTPEQAQSLASLPVTVNGRLPTRTDIDTYRVRLKSGECLVVAGESRALGAPTNPVVRIRDMSGRELLVQMDYRTRDPLLGFTAPADGEYLVELQDVMNNYSTINDDYVYRVTLTTGPWLDYAFPPGAQRGTTAELQLYGWNLGGAAGPSSILAQVPIPADAPARFPVSAGDAPNSVPLAVGDAPEIAESEPNAQDAPQSLAIPGAVNGLFAERGDRDCYRFTAKAGTRLVLDVDARDVGSFADTRLVLLDSAGKAIQTVDDADGSRDPRLVWTAPADGEYTVLLRDLAGGFRGGPGFYYRLTVAAPAPSLQLTTGTPTLVVKPGARLEVSLSVSQAYLEADVVVQAKGLPAGVTAAPATVTAAKDRSATSEVKLTLVAAADAAPGTYSVRIVAKSGARQAAAVATWVLSKDRSGTLATGRTESLLVVIPAP